MSTMLQHKIQTSSQTSMKEEVFHGKYHILAVFLTTELYSLWQSCNCSLVNTMPQTMACQCFSTINSHVRFAILWNTIIFDWGIQLHSHPRNGPFLCACLFPFRVVQSSLFGKCLSLSDCLAACALSVPWGCVESLLSLVMHQCFVIFRVVRLLHSLHFGPNCLHL